MEILEYGPDPRWYREFRGRCCTCQALVRFYAHEGFTMFDEKQRMWVSSAICPACGNHLTGTEVI